MLGQIRRFLSWLSLSRVERHILGPLPAGLKIRVFRPEDAPALQEIHDLNSPGRFPVSTPDSFAKYLCTAGAGFLVAELNGEIVGCGGLLRQDGDLAVFAYGLVHPNHQRKGIGRALFLVRLAQLKSELSDFWVILFGVPDAFQYYARFGFTQIGPWLVEGNKQFPMSLARFSESLRALGIRHLAKHSIEYPLVGDSIPRELDKLVLSRDKGRIRIFHRAHPDVVLIASHNRDALRFHAS